MSLFNLNWRFYDTGHLLTYDDRQFKNVAQLFHFDNYQFHASHFPILYASHFELNEVTFSILTHHPYDHLSIKRRKMYRKFENWFLENFQGWKSEIWVQAG